MKKLTQKQFEKILKTNSKNNPFNIDKYDKQSIINCRKTLKSRNNFYIEFKCSCGKTIKKNVSRTSQINIRFISFCRKCLIEQTNLNRYGVKNAFQVKEIKDKYKKTCIKRYGVDHFSKSENYKNKYKQTCINRYGVSNVSKAESVKQKKKQTCIKKFGVETNLNIESVKNKCSRNKKKNKIEIDKKRKQTMQSRYGINYPMESEEIIKKSFETKMDHYGSLHVNHKYFFNNEYFDSSWELAFYIYHLDKGHKIIHEPISFMYKFDGKDCLYFPDFKVNNKYYEIKGEQFLVRYKNGNIKGMKCPFDKSKNEKYNAKYKCMKKHNVTIITFDKIDKYLNYIIKQYGSLDYLEQFKYE